MNAKRLMMTLSVVAVFALIAVPAASAGTAAAAASENWAGYAVGGGGGPFSSVSASWVQPAVTCGSAAGSTYSAYWVGLGGASRESSALEQVGTQADCSAGGQAAYYSWYELVPAAPVNLPVAVKAGDHMSGRVTVNGRAVTVSITNQTTGAGATRTLTMSNPDASTAEWIAEAPSECDGSGSCQPLALANFGKVDFTSATATANGHTGTITDAGWTAQPITLTPGMGVADLGAGFVGAGAQVGDGSSATAGASPSSLSGDGSSFSVSYAADATAAATSGGGSDYGAGGDGGYGYAYGGGYGYSGGYGYGYGGYGPDGYGAVYAY